MAKDAPFDTELPHFNDLKKYHPDGARPFMSKEGKIYCAYSLEDPPPECPLNHRSEMIEVEVNGVRLRLFQCCDSRMRNLKPEDYRKMEGLLEK